MYKHFNALTLISWKPSDSKKTSTWRVQKFSFSDWAVNIRIFSERMISAANLLVDTHRILLGHDHIDKLIVFRMTKMLMERERHKEDFASIVFHHALSDEYVSSNEEEKY